MANYRFNGVNLVQFGDNIITDMSSTLGIKWTNGNTYFVNYVIKDGDTQENMAYRLWGDSSLSWIINFVNGVIDPFFDWPLRSDELMSYIKNKYGEEHILDTHHYELNGYVVNYSDNPKLETITNYEYEFRKNENKRNILVPTKTFMNDFLIKWSNE